MNFFCVGVVYSGEYDACDVTLSVYPHRASLKNMPGHGGNRTYDLWNTSPMLCQRSYAVRSVVRFPPWPGIFFKLARCGYTLRVTSQASSYECSDEGTYTGINYFADLRMTFRQNFFLQDWFRNKFGVGLG